MKACKSSPTLQPRSSFIPRKLGNSFAFAFKLGTLEEGKLSYMYTTLAHPVESAQIKLLKIRQNGRAYYFKDIKLCRLTAKINTRFQPDAIFKGTQWMVLQTPRLPNAAQFARRSIKWSVFQSQPREPHKGK
jgi:hypothetical protein